MVELFIFHSTEDKQVEQDWWWQSDAEVSAVFTAAGSLTTLKSGLSITPASNRKQNSITSQLLFSCDENREATAA